MRGSLSHRRCRSFPRTRDPARALKGSTKITKKLPRQISTAHGFHIVTREAERAILQRLPETAELFINITTQIGKGFAGLHRFPDDHRGPPQRQTVTGRLQSDCKFRQTVEANIQHFGIIRTFTQTGQAQQDVLRVQRQAQYRHGCRLLSQAVVQHQNFDLSQPMPMRQQARKSYRNDGHPRSLSPPINTGNGPRGWQQGVPALIGEELRHHVGAA